MKDFWLCFVPLFVAVDAIGVLPMFVALTEGLPAAKVRRVVVQSVVTAMGVALAFLAIGKGVFQLLGITVNDFTIAGGALLFVLSLGDLLAADKGGRAVDPESVGAVPLGVPLIVGPAVLTTALLLVGRHGVAATVSAAVVNILVAGIVLWLAGPIHRVLGRAGAKTASKIASLLLAAIAVMLVRKGILALIAGEGSKAG
jgi:multiple antibiotic resistance protein